MPNTNAMDSTGESSGTLYNPKTKVWFDGKSILLSDLISNQDELKKIGMLEDLMRKCQSKAAGIYEDSKPLRNRLNVLDGKAKSDDADINKAFLSAKYGEDFVNNRKAIVSKIEEMTKE